MSQTNACIVLDDGEQFQGKFSILKLVLHSEKLLP